MRALELAGVTRSFGGLTAVDDVSVVFREGEVNAVVGPNGAGKSTLLDVASGLARPTMGRATLEGRPLARYGRRALARRMAVVPQRPDLPAAFTARSVVAMGRTPHQGFFASEGPRDVEVVEAALRRTDALRFAGTPVGALSGGERQRVVLARALAQEPTWLLLDEPTAHLDLRYQADLLGHAATLAHTDGLGVLAVLHDLNQVARFDRLVLLDRGRVAGEGPPERILDPALLSRVYRTPVRVLPGPPPLVTTD